MQLPSDGPHTPLLHHVQAQDLHNQVRGYGHRAVRLAAQRAKDGAGSLAERRHLTGRRSAGNANAALLVSEPRRRGITINPKGATAQRQAPLQRRRVEPHQGLTSSFTMRSAVLASAVLSCAMLQLR